MNMCSTFNGEATLGPKGALPHPQFFFKKVQIYVLLYELCRFFLKEIQVDILLAPLPNRLVYFLFKVKILLMISDRF